MNIDTTVVFVFIDISVLYYQPDFSESCQRSVIRKTVIFPWNLPSQILFDNKKKSSQVY